MCERTFSSNGHMLLKTTDIGIISLFFSLLETSNKGMWSDWMLHIFQVETDMWPRIDTHFPLVFRAEVNALLSSFWVCRQQLGILQLH